MSNTPNYDFNELTEGQGSKEVTINEVSMKIDKKLGDYLDVSAAAGNVVLTRAQLRVNAMIRITDATTAGRTVTLPANKMLVLIKSASANTQPISVVVGTTTFNLKPGQAAVCYTDGTTNGLTQIGANETRRLMNAQTGTTYTPVAADAAKLIRHTNASASTFTIDNNVFSQGDEIAIRQAGTGQLTIAAGSGVTINAPAGFEPKARGQGSTLHLYCVTASSFDLTGDLEATP